jgi:predicted transcriptional regulator
MSDTQSNEIDHPKHPSDDRAIRPLPTGLHSSQAKLVYLTLMTTAGVTISELRASLHMPAIALYPTLETLVDRGLVDREGETYACASDDHE